MSLRPIKRSSIGRCRKNKYDDDLKCSFLQIAGDKSDGAEGVRRAKGAAVVRLLCSVRCESAVVCCNELEDGHWLKSVLTEAGLNVANSDNPPGMPGRDVQSVHCIWAHITATPSFAS